VRVRPLAEALRAKDAVVSGFDLSPDMVELARERLGEDADVRVADLGAPLPYPDDKFDLVVASLALHYVEDWASALAELRRVLKPGGRLTVSIGHAHREIPQRYVTNKQTGHQVLLTEPLYWGMRLSVMDFGVQLRRGRWQVTSATSQVLNSNSVPEDPAVAAAVRDQHDIVVGYVNSVIGTSLQAMSAARAVVEDVPAIDFVNHVQADAVRTALAGTPDAALPVISIAAPFNRSAAIPEGEVTVRDVAGLYIYDNTLMAIRVTGAQVRAYLEFSARYFRQVSGPGPFTMAEVTNAVTPTAPNGTPDYNYDIVSGLDAALTYHIDIAEPPGSRIRDLAYAGVPIADGQQFVMAINNYRQSGGGGFPHVTTAPVVYNRQVEIRQLIIDWVSAKGAIDAAEFASVDWRLVSGGQPVTIS